MENKGLKYEFNIFDLDDMKQLENLFSDLEKVLTSKDFMNYIADKCILQLNQISNNKLGGIRDDDVSYTEVNKYRNNHKIEMKDDVIIISNDTKADLSHLSAKTMKNYPNGFSIAKAIEFGTGIWGSDDDELGWSVQQNPNRNYDKGWYYEKDGMIHWSKGFGGKFIYYELGQYVRDNLSNWVIEYLEAELK